MSGFSGQGTDAWHSKGALYSAPLLCAREPRAPGCQNADQWLPQLAQWPPAHEPQPLELLLATMRLPPPSRETAAKTEMTLRALGAEQRGQAIGASAWLIERSASKRFSQLAQ
jgi:hypothetical protein